MGANRHEFPINGNSFGPGICEYGLADFTSCAMSSSCKRVPKFCSIASSGNILTAEENVVRLTMARAAVAAAAVAGVPIILLEENREYSIHIVVNVLILIASF